MKKFIALALVFVFLTLSLASCGPKDAIKIDPQHFNMPDSYQITYTFIEDFPEGNEYYEDVVATVISGCDTSGNFYYSYEGSNRTLKRVCIGSDDSYKLYELSEETDGKFELIEEDMRWVEAFNTCNDYVGYANTMLNSDKENTYAKIDSLTNMPEGISGKTIDFSDPERFEYFSVKGLFYPDGREYGGFEAVVEKETGACVYVNYFAPEIYTAIGGEVKYYFYATEYAIPYSGNYASIITE